MNINVLVMIVGAVLFTGGSIMQIMSTRIVEVVEAHSEVHFSNGEKIGYFNKGQISRGYKIVPIAKARKDKSE